jgi:uridine kinase
VIPPALKVPGDGFQTARYVADATLVRSTASGQSSYSLRVNDAPTSTTSSRRKVVGRVVDELLGKRPGHPLCVAVDGITASGKTTFARDLTDAVIGAGRPAVQLSMDGYHHPRAHRYRQGRESASGYYEDAYDFEAFATFVLEPLGGVRDWRYVPSVIDLASDTGARQEPIALSEDAVLIVDGSFLQRDLSALWDEVIWLDSAFDSARARGVRRDADALGGTTAAEHRFEVRYHAASRRYVEQERPAERATIVIAHDDPACPALRRIGGSASAMVHLFSYGTLQKPEVQRANFGRLLQGRADRLAGFRTEWVTITDADVIAESGTDRHPIVVAGGSADAVSGTLFELSTIELAAADEYEVDDYARRPVILESGQPAWVYIARAASTR